MPVDDPSPPRFKDLGLTDPLLKALDDVGYEIPSPIQALTIPVLLEGHDLVGQAQTGTGKTAAFALPLLAKIDIDKLVPQLLVLAPTRELAIQVAEAFQRYAKHIKGFHVLPIYGGQDYGGQFRQLKRGVHVVVGTPGRVMDHMRRGTLNLAGLKGLVLDEADEMLRMGFIDDVQWILEQTPSDRQIALFSATMPEIIRRIARQHLRDPKEISIEVRTATAETIRQQFWMVSGLHKLDALTRILEAETFDGMLVFVRTKIATQELAEKLQARGFSSAALNGDISQQQRERTLARLKQGALDILVATDVAARGLDVDRISHVINYDIPTDTESYIHRIGRTGRMGREGTAILFVSPREKHLLRNIERAVGRKILPMELPSTETINDRRIAAFKQRITDALATEELELFREMIEQYQREHNVPALEIAAGLAKMAQGDTPLLLYPPAPSAGKSSARSPQPKPAPAAGESAALRPGRTKQPPKSAAAVPDGKRPAASDQRPKTEISDRPAEGMERYRLEVGSSHGVKAANIVGAIANEAGLEGRYISELRIHADYSTVDLPEGMPREIFRALKKSWVAGRRLNISRLSEPAVPEARKQPRKRRIRQGELESRQFKD